MKEKINIPGATVDFFISKDDNTTIYEFDTSKSTPPHPMINAMAGLQMLADKSKLVMINHHSPDGLFPKINKEFDYEIAHLEDGTVKIVFSKKENATSSTDFTQTSCKGGCER